MKVKEGRHSWESEKGSQKVDSERRQMRRDECRNCIAN